MIAPSGRPRARTVLVVEDEPATLRALRQVLDRSGYETMAATTAEDATALLRERAVHAVVFELNVVQADPAAFLHAWRSLRPGTPLILCAAWDPGRLTTLFGDGPPDGFVPKPFTGIRLYVELQRAARSRPRPAATIAAWQAPQLPPVARPMQSLGSAR